MIHQRMVDKRLKPHDEAAVKMLRARAVLEMAGRGFILRPLTIHRHLHFSPKYVSAFVVHIAAEVVL